MKPAESEYSYVNLSNSKETVGILILPIRILFDVNYFLRNQRNQIILE